MDSNVHSEEQPILSYELQRHLIQNDMYFEKLLSTKFTSTDIVLTCADQTRIKEAYDKAHHIREFELSLYWQRLNYIWAITIVLFTGWGFVVNGMISADKTSSISGLQYFEVFAISIFGFLFSTVSIFITQAGKYWQIVWEYHIKKLEPFCSGNIYAMKFFEQKYIPSISRSVEIFQYMLLVIWGMSTLLSAFIPFFNNRDASGVLNVIISVILTISYLYLKGKLTKRKSDKDLNISNS